MVDFNDDSNVVQLFENQRIRTAWDEESEEWYNGLKRRAMKR